MHNEILKIGSLTITGYGLMIAIGLLAAIFLADYRAKKRGLDDDAVWTIAILVASIGFIGAKLLFVIVEFDMFLEDPMAVLGSQGFVVYGGIIVGALTGYIYTKVKKIDFLTYLDLVIPSVSVAQGFGRIGCFLAGCCYGRETTTALGVVFPEGSLAPAGISLLPTQIYSSVGNFIIAGILIWYSTKTKVKGNVGAMYMLLYGIGRFAVEILRNDSRGSVGQLSTSQFISIFIVLGGIVLFAVNNKRAKNTQEVISEEE